MDTTALFTISYGVYALSTNYNNTLNACIINTALQVTQDPLRLSITVLKSNYTHNLILSSNQFNVSVLGEQATLDMIGRFGLQSGRNVNKFEGFDYGTDILSNPVIEQGCLSTISCKVMEAIDLGTHTLFIADVVDAKHLEQGTPMTYSYYRDLKTGRAKQKEAKKTDIPTYQCTICHYIYDGEIAFEELPADYLCPLCNQPKSSFIKN